MQPQPAVFASHDIERHAIKGRLASLNSSGDPKPRFATTYYQPKAAIRRSAGSVGRGRLRATAGMRVVMTKDSWPTRASRLVSSKKRSGVQLKMPRRVSSHVGGGADVVNPARRTQQQPAYLTMIRSRQGQYLVHQRP
ncbi:hypothetical protein BV98_002600 [Sphingobium herbicidovorans NBRC 16415]|uniref:Uncharacterized protein n=1 Tax=Sphingobium herbicidovorans (strain ATCC 700291 / DSM 11019 / CCUG 56400 / KCTC 2939 / LMG 18315 / NBRC 16415 / MH) TaxID=1219045 RepID=A0A086P8S1_SPHHM|nr:hypothetical protein BV98_002600 [Sphingobium herbicidovorans NBRC 16415]